MGAIDGAPSADYIIPLRHSKGNTMASHILLCSIRFLAAEGIAKHGWETSLEAGTGAQQDRR